MSNDIKKFANIEELKKAIESDVAVTLQSQ